MHGAIYFPRRGKRWYSWWTWHRQELLLTFIHVAGVREPWALMYSRTGMFDGMDLDTKGTYMSNLIKKLIDRKKAEDGRQVIASDEALEQMAPTVHELLTTVEKQKGKIYESACLIIFAGQGCFRATVSNKALDFKRSGEGQTMLEAIKDLETRVGREEEQTRPAQRVTHKGTRNGQDVP